MFEIDRGQPDDSGLRRVQEGGTRAAEWAGPSYAPDGIGLYEQDEKGRWWPTDAALAAGFLPCRSCEMTNRKRAIVLTPREPEAAAELVAVAEQDRRKAEGRSLTRDELAGLLRDQPDWVRGPSSSNDDRLEVVEPVPTTEGGSAEPHAVSGPGEGWRLQVVRKLLELRAREAPLGSSGYRGVLTQKAIANVAGVRVQDVTKIAIELDRGLE